MCDPVSIGSMAVGAAGSAINGYERSRSQADQINARNAVTRAELDRQRQYGDQSRASFGDSLNIYAPGAQAAGLTSAQSSVGDTIARNAPTNVGSISTGNAPAAVANGEQSRLAGVFQQAAQRDENLGNLKGYDQQSFDNKVGLNRNGQTIDTIGDFARTSSGVSQIEGRAAQNNAARSPSGIGDLLQFVGTVGANRAGRGSSIFGSGSGGGLPFAPMTSAGAIY